MVLRIFSNSFIHLLTIHISSKSSSFSLIFFHFWGGGEIIVCSWTHTKRNFLRQAAAAAWKRRLLWRPSWFLFVAFARGGNIGEGTFATFSARKWPNRKRARVRWRRWSLGSTPSTFTRRRTKLAWRRRRRGESFSSNVVHSSNGHLIKWGAIDEGKHTSPTLDNSLSRENQVIPYDSGMLREDLWGQKKETSYDSGSPGIWVPWPNSRSRSGFVIVELEVNCSY